jgi:hypothetical protein
LAWLRRYIVENHFVSGTFVFPERLPAVSEVWRQQALRWNSERASLKTMK